MPSNSNLNQILFFIFLLIWIVTGGCPPDKKGSPVHAPVDLTAPLGVE